MKTYTATELAEIVKLHGMWLRNEVGGSRANLRSANLSSANLYSADLRYADLRSANLSSANLRSANLYSANLRSANLRSANLRSANLYSADLYSANLRSAENSELHQARISICPEGDLIGWKKCNSEDGSKSVIVKLLIPAKSPRSNATGRKCRAKHVKVLAIEGGSVGVSQHDGKTEYRKGKTVKCDSWCEDRWQECAGGIHFYITRLEAEAH